MFPLQRVPFMPWLSYTTGVNFPPSSLMFLLLFTTTALQMTNLQCSPLLNADIDFIHLFCASTFVCALVIPLKLLYFLLSGDRLDIAGEKLLIDSMSIQRVSSAQLKYDVFLSFKGEDTHSKFVDHLHTALQTDGISVFSDDKTVERENEISLESLKAIEDSRISVIVFSRNYAFSIWCLEELVKIVQCMNTFEQTVIPIFYDVDPSTVRKQKGSFKEAFVEHEKAFKEDLEKLQMWKRALTEVANLTGWDARDRPEFKIIQEVVLDILHKLTAPLCTKFEGLVGIDSRLEKLRMLLGSKMSNGVHVLCIYGMGGIGKTTLARIIFKLISCEFDGSSFLANVREVSGKYDGLVSLQKQLLFDILQEKEIDISDVNDGMDKISKRLQNKKVLIIIDDVVHKEQLEKLAGRCNWFGSGSRIIITTRDEHLLEAQYVDDKYKVEELNHKEGLQLFILKAFKNHQPSEVYWNLSNHVVRYSSGIPLVLEVLGSFLFDRTIDEWKDALKRLERDSKKEILERLEISLSGLEYTEKEIFLDIACFFKGYDRGYVSRILNGCHFNPIIGLNVLIEKSLITILNNNQVWMHDSLQEMGQQIVKRESPNEPGKRSRLWEEEDVLHVLTKETGTELVEGIMLEKQLNLSASAGAFSKMINLRLLKIHNVKLPNGIEYFSNELRLLEWHGYPLKSLQSNLLLNKVVELDLSYSSIDTLWGRSRNQSLKELKSMKLRGCRNLRKTPDLSEIPNLEELILEGCTNLREIHPSLLAHEKIILLNLRNCTRLPTLPSKIHMKSLQTLYLSGCSKFKSEEEEYSKEFDRRGTTVKQPLLSISVLGSLEKIIFGLLLVFIYAFFFFGLVGGGGPGGGK